MVKAEIERASGVPVDAQRLLCRGRVLCDETNMERARVEDGDTLLMVQSAPPAANGEDGRDDAREALRDDPHAPENVENRMRGMMGFPPPGAGTGVGSGMGTIGDLSRMIATMLAAAPFSTGGAGGAGGGRWGWGWNAKRWGGDVGVCDWNANDGDSWGWGDFATGGEGDGGWSKISQSGRRRGGGVGSDGADG